MTDASTTITPADPTADEAVLGELLAAFHGWMAQHADAYEPDAELAEDVRTLTQETDSWAWIAEVDGTPAGCVLLYGLSDELAEFKRLWVRPVHRGHGIGRALTETVAEAARDRGYATLGLTTPPWGEAAQALYESMGFDRTSPYPGTRLPERHHDEAIFMRLDLSSTG